MGRSIKYQDSEGNIESYNTRLLKLIPAEMVAAYLTILGIVGSPVTSEANTTGVHGLMNIIRWSVFVLFVLATPLYQRRVLKVESTKQIAIVTIGFIIWVFSIGGPFNAMDSLTQPFPETNPDFNLREVLGSILLVFYTFILPIFVKSFDANNN